MIAYSTLGVNDMTRAIGFYDAVFAPLGAVRDTTSETWTGYSSASDRAKFFLTRFSVRSRRGDLRHRDDARRLFFWARTAVS